MYHSHPTIFTGPLAMARLLFFVVVVVAIITQCILPSNGYAIGSMGHSTTNGLHIRTQPRHRRNLINLFSDQHKPEYHTGNNSPVLVNSGGGGLPSTTPAENWLKFARQQSSRFIEGAADVAMAPMHWLSHIRQYW